jgi:hypothetical protein
MRRTLTLVVATAVTAVTAAGPLHANPRAPAAGGALAEVRAATAVYHDIDRAMEAGYALGSPCIPGMGFHYVRDVAADQDDLDPLSPQILVYAPRPDGSLQLVAVEYASWESAELFGRTFDAPHPEGGPPFHTLHAWIWRGNPDGVFAPMNPNVSCG